MKKIICIILFVAFNSNSFGQQITLDELFTFTKSEPEQINNILESKNWFYKGRKDYKGENFIQFDEPVTSVTWTINTNDKKDNSSWTHSIIYYEHFEFKDEEMRYKEWKISDVEIRRRITYMTTKKPDYDYLHNSITQKYKKTEDKLLEDTTLKVYDGISCWIMVGYGVEKPTIYNITLVSKYGK
jgi:hypothetical protein